MSETVTKDVLRLLGDDFRECQSPSLRLEKYVHLGDNSKKGEIEAVVKCHALYAKPIPAVEPKGGVSFVAKLRSRLIVNQAGGILENAGLCLHPHFGTPYIPGSAVKGVARHAAWCEWNGEKNEARKDRLAIQIAEVFGYPTNDNGLDGYLAMRGWKNRRQSGSVAFLPAVPLDKGALVVDLVNCHHPKYYAGDGKFPFGTDNESPNPQFFPAVEAGVQFVFSLFPCRDLADLDAARKWLVKALTENGAGAKTAAGYGWFDCDPSLTDARNAKLAEERRRAKVEALKAAWAASLESLSCKPDMELRGEEIDALAAKLEEIGDKTFSDANIGTLNALRKRLPQLSPRDEMCAKWAGMTPKAVVGTYIRNFKDIPDERKQVVVALLREEAGPGSAVWSFLKTDKKCQSGEIASAVMLIRQFSKQNFNPGRMP